MSSASGQKLFCEVCSVFKCSFDEFVGEKVVSPSYFSAILAPPLLDILFRDFFHIETPQLHNVDFFRFKSTLFLLFSH